MGYLRRVRLEAMHRELQAADPDDPAVSVAHIAARWGFTPKAHVAEFYRAELGESPSETLRRRD
jgi:AraC-like DNA-binding protein